MERLNVKIIRECEKQLQAVAIADPKELNQHIMAILNSLTPAQREELYLAVRDLICTWRF